MSMCISTAQALTKSAARVLLAFSSKHFDCAGSHKTVVAVLWRGIFLENSCIKWFSRHVHVHFTTAQARAKNCCRGPRARHFPWTFSHQTALLRCPCAFRLRRLAQTVILVRRSCGDPGEVLCKRSLHDLVQALVRRSWSKILWVSLHDFYRSFWGDLVEILFGSSLRGLASRSWRCSAWYCAGS